MSWYSSLRRRRWRQRRGCAWRGGSEASPRACLGRRRDSTKRGRRRAVAAETGARGPQRFLSHRCRPHTPRAETGTRAAGRTRVRARKRPAAAGQGTTPVERSGTTMWQADADCLGNLLSPYFPGTCGGVDVVERVANLAASGFPAAPTHFMHPSGGGGAGRGRSAGGGARGFTNVCGGRRFAGAERAA